MTRFRIALDDDDRRTIAVALVALTVFALVLRLAGMTGLVGDDDLKYARYAQAIMDGRYAQAVADARGHELLHWSIRYGLLLPLAAIYSLFGVSEWSTIALPLLASTASVPLVALIGRQLFNWRVGLIAGLLYATFPLQLRYATVLVPEPVAECFALVAVVCYLRARTGSGADTERHAWAWYVAAGLMFGVAYLTKESALFIAGAVLLHAVWDRQWRGALFLALGVCAVVAAEHAYYVLGQGDLMFRTHVTVFYDVHGVHGTHNPNPDLMYRWFKYYPRRMLVPSAFFGLHSLACLVWAALALRLRPKAGHGLLMLWAVVPWLYLNFGTSSFARYVVLPAQARYIEFTYPPLILLSAVTIVRALARPRSIAIAAAVSLALVATVGAATGIAMRGQAGRVAAEMSVLREIARRSNGTTGRTVYSADLRWREALEILAPSVVTRSRDHAGFMLVADPVGLPSLRPASPEGHDLAGPHR